MTAPRATSGTTSMQGGLPGQSLRSMYPPEQLAAWLEDARRRTLLLIEDLDEDRLLGPRRDQDDPILWLLGRLGWFMERWVLRRDGREPLLGDADTLFDPASVPSASRWDLQLPTRVRTLEYLNAVHEHVLDRLDRPPSRLDDTYFILRGIFHEDLLGEVLVRTRQIRGDPLPRPPGKLRDPARHAWGHHGGDVAIPGGRFLLGALPGEAFVFDNEKWAHPVDLAPFGLARSPVTQSEFMAFLDAGGYWRKEYWSEDGWQWRERAAARHPVYWLRDGQQWYRRDFERLVAIEPDWPMFHVNWYEAEAYCRWAGRRLPTEAEWEVAAAAWLAEGTGCPGLSSQKRRYPWGDEPPASNHANLDGNLAGCIDVAACPDGDSGWGCRQMMGNVWEWTSSDFLPYPGFAIDPDQGYSWPSFGTHKVLRGGCWMTRARLLRNTWRHFSRPECRDGWTGFRTCARAG